VQCSGTMYNTTDAGSKVINDFRNQISSIVVVAHASADRQTDTHCLSKFFFIVGFGI